MLSRDNLNDDRDVNSAVIRASSSCRHFRLLNGSELNSFIILKPFLLRYLNTSSARSSIFNGSDSRLTQLKIALRRANSFEVRSKNGAKNAASCRLSEKTNKFRAPEL